jgi:hypothetical protein
MDFMQAIQEVIPDFKSEVVAVQSSFEKQILSGSIVKPFFVPFDKDNKKPFVSFIRDWNQSRQDDYYTSIVEMISVFPSIVNTNAYMLVIHPATNQFFDPENLFGFGSVDNIVIFVISDDYGLAVEIKYTIDSQNQKISWQDSFEIVEIKDIKNPLTEMLYIYSHIDESAFSYAEHLNYLSHLNTHVMIVDPTSKINHMYNYPKGLFKSTTLV